MRGNALKKVFAVLPVAVLAAMPAFAQQQGAQQSQTGDAVADAARKAREEKKTAPKAKKVFTEDDIAPRLQAPAAAAQPAQTGEKGPATTQAAQGTSGAQEAGKPKEDPNSEAAWRKRFAAQYEKIDKAEQELDVLQREVQKSDVQYYSDPQKAMNEQNTRKEINDKTAKIAEKKQEIAQLKQQLADMEDRLRKSGGDPGWARH